jgi:hypothetical protein
MATAEMQRRDGEGFCSCFSPSAKHVGDMSLNRCEQRVFDYIKSHPEERHYWQAKVQTVCRNTGDDHVAAAELDGGLWRYYEERSQVASPFREAARSEGLRRTSMRNLAELLIRLWTEPRVKKKAAVAESSD